MKFNTTFLPSLLLKSKESKINVKKERVNKNEGQEEEGRTFITVGI